MSPDKHTHRSRNALAAPFAATRRLCVRTVALAALLTVALLWLSVLALATTTSVAPPAIATTSHPLPPSTTAAFSLDAVLSWLRGRSHATTVISTTTAIPIDTAAPLTPLLRSIDTVDSSNAAAVDPLVPIATASIDPFNATYNESLALYLARVTSVSYCHAANIRDWSCQPCLLVPRFQVVEVVSDARLSFQGLVGYSAEIDAIVVAFRGSMDFLNWLDNMTFIKMRAYATYPNVLVHRGFYWVYHSVALQLVPQVQALVAAHPTAQVRVTGHSLGAAVAAICAFELAFLHGVDVASLYTFGAPRVGNYAFRTTLLTSPIDVFRITHFRDIVPHLPPTWIGFEHTTREVFYDEFQSSYTLCNDTVSEDVTCSNACSPFGCTSVVDHLTYLNVTMSHLIC